jgi:type 2 lantibiotic biosynthesis protein LanM
VEPLDLSWRGATLTERIAFVRARQLTRPPAGGDGPSDWEARWAKACAGGDDARFQRRLAWDRIDRAEARAAFAETVPDDFPVAGWVALLPALAEQARAVGRRLTTPDGEREIEAVSEETGLPFIEAWLPIVDWARARLDRRSPSVQAVVGREAMSAWARLLARDACGVGELAVWEDFRLRAAVPPGDGCARYSAYVAELLGVRYQVFLEAAPVLARHLVLLAGQWVDFVVAFAADLQADRDAIASTFGRAADRITTLVPGLSDRHEGGRRVAMVEFASGLRLAYKPRSVAIERVFNDWLRSAAAAGFAAAPPAIRVLDRQTHGWVEWVEQADFDDGADVIAYYRAAGSLACLAWVLGGADLHGENVVASLRGPVVIDAEMLLQPAAGAEPPALDSCLAPGLISLVTVPDSGPAYDVGGLRESPEREAVVPGRAWTKLRSDDIGFTRRMRVRPVLRNDVRLGGVVQRPEDHAEAVSGGFAEAYAFLRGGGAGSLVEDLAHCPTRVLLRPSNRYGALLFVLAAPRYQRSGIDRSLGIETLLRDLTAETGRPRLWPLVADDEAALESLDIPRWTIGASHTSLTGASGASVDGFYGRSGAEAARHRVGALDDHDLEYQIDQIRAALSRSSAAGVAGRDDGDALLRAAERIGHEVLSRARVGDGESLVWPATRGRADLYAGSSGIALLFAALHAGTGRGEWRHAAVRALAGAHAAGARGERSHTRIGGCNGLPSIAYSGVLAGALIGDETLVDQGVATAIALPAARLEADAVLDVEGGLAGALLALLAIHAVRPDPALLDAAARCVSRLVASQLADGPASGGWPAGVDRRPRPGFAHGAAGITLALARAWAAGIRQAGVPAALAAGWGFERRLFAAHGVWPTIRADGSAMTMTAWCHGAPGIGLGRACTPAGLADAEVTGEIDVAVRWTASAPWSHLDHPCCGNLGRADVLLTVGQRLEQPSLVGGAVSVARAVADLVLSRGRLGLRGQGYLRGAADPSFFQGLAGIGYVLVRAALPAKVPSVLAFDVPEATGNRAHGRSERYDA